MCVQAPKQEKYFDVSLFDGVLCKEGQIFRINGRFQAFLWVVNESRWSCIKPLFVLIICFTCVESFLIPFISAGFIFFYLHLFHYYHHDDDMAVSVTIWTLLDKITDVDVETRADVSIANIIIFNKEIQTVIYIC